MSDLRIAVVGDGKMGRAVAALAPERGIEVATRRSNMSNGLTYDAELNLLACEHATSTVVRERADGTR